jgi:membrane peptidoglycan carboxypeptidase
MVQRTSPFRVPFPRRLLIRIHHDLFGIESRSRGYVLSPTTLTTLEKMILISEDRRFFRHNGVDYRACIREVWKAITFRRFGGASTIDMQFVRTATGYYERNMRRKLYEMLLAWIIQFKFTKIEILRYYLKIAFFGSHLYGIDTANRVLFSKHRQEDLTLKESALLAAMLIYPRPSTYSERWESNVRRRSAYLMSLYPRFEQRFEKLPRWEAV